jgi:hypothetical protein
MSLYDYILFIYLFIVYLALKNLWLYDILKRNEQ